jgi:uncharacterized membrane protein YfcA
MTFTIATMLFLVMIGAGAGLLGALVGIGGGVVLVPVLVLGFGVDMRDAVAVSLVAVVATSTSAGSVYVGEGLANMRLGMTLEIATTIGGMVGGLVAVVIPTSVLSGLFAAILVVSALLLVRGRDPQGHGPAEAHEREEMPEMQGCEEPGKLAGRYFDVHAGKLVHYEAQRLGLGSAVALLAGAMSGMLGVGGGFLKVPAMTLGMRVPMRVAAATSNFMIGVTAIASLSVYLVRGYVRPLLAAPLVIGVIGGSLLGTKLSHRVHAKLLRIVLALVLGLVAVEMALRTFGVHLAR